MIESISQSMVGAWLRCGLQFENRYLNNEIMPPGIAARRGSAVHKASELNNRQKISTQTDLPLDMLQDAARDEYVRLLKEEGVFIPKEQLSEKTAILNEGLNQAVDATGVYRKEVAPLIQPIFVEQRVIVDIGLDLPISGRLDLGTQGHIRDIKTHGITRNQEWADRELQPDFYYPLYKEITGEYPQDFIYDALVPLKGGTRYNQITTRRNNSHARLTQYCKAFLRDLNSGIFRPADPDGWMCSPRWCGWWNSCNFGSKNRTITI